MRSKAYMYDLSFFAEDFIICKVREIINETSNLCRNERALKQNYWKGFDHVICTTALLYNAHWNIEFFGHPVTQKKFWQVKWDNEVQITAVWACVTNWRFQRPIESWKISLEAKPCNSVRWAHFMSFQSVSIDDNIWHSYFKTARWQYTIHPKKTRFREPMGWGIQEG